jgi:hypothetical protein|tara:strand:- start:291 stop:881 length:591 start_codon:yes stop_codon:yes gene_type:complete
MRYSQLTEAAATDIAVFYGGRFQPMHSGHYQVYMDLVRKFGSSNVFIATTIAKNATPEKDPFTQQEKTMLMQKMFNISSDKILNTQPYKPDVGMTGKDPDNTALLLVFSEKDAGRLKTGGYLRAYKDGEQLTSSDEAGYIYSVPVKDDGRSATTFRNIMRMPGVEEVKKQEAFKDFFGSFNPEVYEFIKDKLNGDQ